MGLWDSGDCGIVGIEGIGVGIEGIEGMGVGIEGIVGMVGMRVMAGDGRRWPEMAEMVGDGQRWQRWLEMAGDGGVGRWCCERKGVQAVFDSTQ